MKKAILTILTSAVLMGTLSFAALAHGAPPRFHKPAYEQQQAKRIAIERRIHRQQLERRARLARIMHDRHR